MRTRLFTTLQSLMVVALGVVLAGAATAQKETPPAPAAPRSVTIPKPVEQTLKNGLRVIVIEDDDIPLVSAGVVIKNGGEVDPADQRSGRVDGVTDAKRNQEQNCSADCAGHRSVGWHD